MHRYGYTLVMVIALPLLGRTEEISPRSDLRALPCGVSSFGATTCEGWIYVYGGHKGKTHSYSTETTLGTFHRLNLAAPTRWEALPGGPKLQGLGLVAHKGKIYRIGGMQPRNKPEEKGDHYSLVSCACYDPATRKWAALPDLPEGRSSHDVVVAGDKLIVVGGWKMNGAAKEADWHRTALMLDLTRTPLQWQSIEQPFQRRALTAATYKGKVYVGGGMTPDSEIELTVNVYDPASNRWSKGPALPGPRRNGFSPAACTSADRLYFSLGNGKLVRLAAGGDAWEEVGQLKQPRIVHRMVTGTRASLVVLGGSARGQTVAGTEAIIPQEPKSPRSDTPR